MERDAQPVHAPVTQPDSIVLLMNIKKNTQRALFELAFALIDDPAGREELAVYGDIPEHLKDALIDLMAEGMEEARVTLPGEPA